MTKLIRDISHENECQINKKQKGVPITAAKKQAPSNVVNLMDALLASIWDKGKTGKGKDFESIHPSMQRQPVLNWSEVSEDVARELRRAAIASTAVWAVFVAAPNNSHCAYQA